MDGPPSQPMQVKESKHAYSYHSQVLNRKKSYSRCIQPSWYQKYPWITVCTTSYKIFCHPCRFARQKGLITFSRRQAHSFVEEGFYNWKKALEKLEEHDKSEMHKEALLKQAAYSSGTDVSAQLSAQHSRAQKHNQRMLIKLISSIHFLARQGLSLRGHSEDVGSLDGNLYRLLLLRSEDCPELKSWVYKKEYTSPDIVNEIISIMGKTVLRGLLSRIRSSLWFSIIADEATDISRNEQMSLSIRWTDDDYNIYEECIGLVQLPDTRAHTIFTLIKDLLIRCSLPLSQCRGQAFDGAANMSGIRNGVQALLKKEENRALYVHCLAHSLNLCVQTTTKQCEMIRNVMEFVYELVQLIKFSPKRLTLFDSIRTQAALDCGEQPTPSLRSICSTRWTVRNRSIHSIILNYRAIIHTLVEVTKGNDEYAAKANGLLTRMESFEVFFGLKLAHLIFSASEQFSTNIQGKDTNVYDATHGAELLASHYKSLRIESRFNSFYEDVLKQSSGLTDEPSLPRYRKRPRRFDEGEQPHCYQIPKERYRHLYFEALECAYGEVERRFKQADFQVIQSLECLLIKAANNQKAEPEECLMKYLEKDINVQTFCTQLTMVADMIKTAFQHTPVKKVTSLRTIADAMNQSEIYKRMLGEIDKVLKLYFTFPVTSSTAERSFSSLRRLKSFLRSTMTQSRLNNLLLLYVHTSETDDLELENIAREFISVNTRRLNYFGKI